MNEAEIAALRWAGKDQDIPLGDGLYIRVRRSSKTYLLRQRHGGKTIRTTIGMHPGIKLKAARQAALRLSKARNPDTTIVADLAEDYQRDVVSQLAHPEHIDGYFKRVIVPDLGKRRVRDVTRADLAGLVKAYRTRSVRGADILRRTLTDLFAFAVEHGLIEDNPGAALSRRVSGYRYEPRTRTLTDVEICAVWAAKGRQAAALRFMLLTGCRVGEILRGKPWEADGDVWVIPAAVAKNRREHRVFLTESARAQLPEPIDLATPLTIQRVAIEICQDIGSAPHFTPHDCRRTCETRLLEIGVLPHVAERFLNHTPTGMLRVYAHAELWPERVEAAKAMERHLLDVVANGAPGYKTLLTDASAGAIF
ncbi:MAG: integrase family protein [Rhodoferax sp.]|nr:integrase family protein [Rhodoferax sp.]